MLTNLLLIEFMKIQNLLVQEVGNITLVFQANIFITSVSGPGTLFMGQAHQVCTYNVYFVIEDKPDFLT